MSKRARTPAKQVANLERELLSMVARLDSACFSHVQALTQERQRIEALREAIKKMGESVTEQYPKDLERWADYVLAADDIRGES